MLTAPLLLALTLAPADASPPPEGVTPPQAEVEDLSDLQGEWEIVGCRMNGLGLIFAGDCWIFAGDKACIQMAAIRKGFGRFSIRRSTAPAEIDVTNGGKVTPGIYHLSGDELLLAWD